LLDLLLDAHTLDKV